MLRWAEWCVLSFTMTFLVESIDSRELRAPLLSAASQVRVVSMQPLGWAIAQPVTLVNISVNIPVNS